MSHTTLTLMRHAKSSWNNANQSDHDRPLNERGNRDAPVMAQRLKSRDSVPQLILCSSAVRTRETAAHLLDVFGDPSPQIQYMNALYLASPETMLTLLAEVSDDISHVMLIAHNPGIEELSAALSSSYADTLPTAAIRQFTCPDISDLARLLSTPDATGIQLVYSDYPKNTAD